MRIANPMYDAAFKYLVDDQAAARLLVGAVLGEEIVSLEALSHDCWVVQVPLRASRRRTDLERRLAESGGA